MCMLKLVLYTPGKWHNIRAIINLIYMCNESEIRRMKAVIILYYCLAKSKHVYMYIWIYRFIRIHTDPCDLSYFRTHH